DEQVSMKEGTVLAAA
nr:alpha-amylase, 1,4-alpha-D-glucanglucanohydrolase {N-terminal} {EC 3.2.1.1} [Streptococcus bovis, JB1, Peptide Partial, 15 aa] [Streptococcus equinus]